MAKKQRSALSVTREENFPEWYQQVVKEADLAENSPVRGCMVIKPYGYALWDNIKIDFDAIIKDTGVENAYFPLLIPLSFMEKEAEHVEGFAKECAVVTHHRLEADTENGGLKPAGELSEPMIIRPTSETIIGHSFAKWVNSYRDLPMKINQWANVMRWEMRTRLFLRTSEFLWQEGHNVFATETEATDNAIEMMNTYNEFFEEYLAIPGIPGIKTEDERFPGAVETYTVEQFMQDGKALQSATSHDLGQNFSQSSGIKFQSKEGQEEFAWTTSWGLSTRVIGGLIMVHADDDGMVMPPRIAPYQVVIIPFTKKDIDEEALLDYCSSIKFMLSEFGIDAKIEDGEHSAPDKLWSTIKKGVPIRVEIGGRELEEDTVTFVRRDIGRDSKQTLPIQDFLEQLPETLFKMQDEMLEKAKKSLEQMGHEFDDVDDVRKFFADESNAGYVKVPTSMLDNPELDKIRSEFSVTPRCKPIADNGEKVILSRAY